LSIGRVAAIREVQIVQRRVDFGMLRKLRGSVTDGMTTPTVRLGLLRGFSLRVGPDPVALTWSAQRLVAFLALQDRPLSRSYVAEVLWPETTTARANANLRSALWRTKRSCRRLIAASSQQLSIAAGVVIDHLDAVARAQRLLDGAARDGDDLGAALRADLAADLLPEWDGDDWVVVERERYLQLRLHALEAMCGRLTEIGRYGEAVEAGLAAVRAEPLRESAHRSLIRVHLAEGNRWEAVRQYERCRRLLLDELGVEPSEALRDLLPAPSREPVAVPRHRRGAVPVNVGFRS
jgi:DNA-binding SARP family transcriptional activator